MALSWAKYQSTLCAYCLLVVYYQQSDAIDSVCKCRILLFSVSMNTFSYIIQFVDCFTDDKIDWTAQLKRIYSALNTECCECDQIDS